jgi:hypothetical protein
MIHTICVLPAPVHIYHLYASCEQSPYVITFHTDPTELDRFTTPEKKVLPTPPLSPAEWSVGSVSVSLPTQPLKQGA